MQKMPFYYSVFLFRILLEFLWFSSGHDNLSSTDEEADDDLSGSEAEFSAGEMEARVK